MVNTGVFFELATILGIASILGVIGYKLKQPLIVAFIAAGIISGPSFLGIIESHEQISLLSNIGISLLLFVVGLRLDINLIKTMGPVALATGLGQVLFTSVFGFLISLAFGMSLITSAYVSVALTFSSTIIIIKLLSDKKEVDSLHGRIAVGFLIVQDIVAIAAMIGLNALGATTEIQTNLVRIFVPLFVNGIIFIIAIGLSMRFILPALLKKLAENQELLVLFAIAWAVLLGAIGEYLGFSKEVGAFVGGISLASTNYKEAIGSRLVVLRDFLLLFFFIELGSRLNLTTITDQMGKALVFSVFILIGNPIIVLAIMGIMGYRKRTGFLAGLTVAQISEFSLILIALGVSLKHLSVETLGLVTMVGIITICCSTYMILYSNKLYLILSPLLSIFERKKPYREIDSSNTKIKGHIDEIIIGLGNYGGNLATNLVLRGKLILGVDFDPQVISEWRKRNVRTIYGDATDPDFIDHLPLNNASWVVSTIRDSDFSTTLINHLKEKGYRGRIAVTSKNIDEALILKKAGAHRVFKPYLEASELAADLLTESASFLSTEKEWPFIIKDVRLPTGSNFSGKKISDLDLREKAGVTILSIHRAGKAHLDPDSEFRIFPGDHIVIAGLSGDVKNAIDLLGQRDFGLGSEAEKTHFEMMKATITNDSPIIGKTLSELKFRQNYGVTIIGILRNNERIFSPKADVKILEDDCLLIVGRKHAVDTFAIEGATCEIKRN